MLEFLVSQTSHLFFYQILHLSNPQLDYPLKAVPTLKLSLSTSVKISDLGFSLEGAAREKERERGKKRKEKLLKIKSIKRKRVYILVNKNIVEGGGGGFWKQNYNRKC